MKRQIKHSQCYMGDLQSLTVVGEQEEVVYAANEGEYYLGTAKYPVRIISISGVIYVNGSPIPTVNELIDAGMEIMVKVTVGALFRYHRAL